MNQKTRSELQAATMPLDASAALNVANAALAASPKIAEAIARNANDITAARAEFEVAADVLAKAEAVVALADDEVSSKKLEREAIKCGEVAEEKRQRLDRLDRIGKALKAKALENDLDVSQARDALRAAAGNFTSDLVQTISAEIAEAAEPLLAVLFRAHALQNTIPHSELGRALSEMRVSNPASWAHPFIDNNRTFFAGKLENLSQAWQNDPAAKALQDALLPIRDTLRSLAKHAERPIPAATGHGYEIRSWPARAPQQPQAARSQPALEGNPAAGVADTDFAAMTVADALNIGQEALVQS